MTQSISKKQGFTLIELLMVIAIIGLLSSIILATLSGARRKAQEARIASDFHQLQIAIETYSISAGRYFDPCEEIYCEVSSDLADLLVPKYISAIPTSPLPNLYSYNYISINPDMPQWYCGGKPLKSYMFFVMNTDGASNININGLKYFQDETTEDNLTIQCVGN